MGRHTNANAPHRAAAQKVLGFLCPQLLPARIKPHGGPLGVFHASDRKPNLSLLKNKRNIVDAVTEKSMGSSSFRPGFIQGLHIISPGPGFSLFHLLLPIPLVWLHPDTPSTDGDKMAATTMHLFCRPKESFLRLSKSPRTPSDFLPDLYDFLSSTSFKFNLLFFF